MPADRHVPTEFEIWAKRSIEALASANNEKGAKIQVLEQQAANRDATIAQLLARLDQVEQRFTIAVASRGSGPTAGG